MKPSIDAPSPEKLLARAQAAFVERRDADALQAAADALALRPNWPPALLSLANASLRSGQLDSAIEALQKLCQLAPPAPPLLNALATALNNRGSSARKSGDETRALADFDAALAHRPSHALAGFNRALCLIALNRPTEADAALRLHLQRHPHDLEAQLELQLLQPESPQRMEALYPLLSSPGLVELPVELRLRAEAAGPMPERALPLLQQLPEPRQPHWAWKLGERLRLNNQTAAARQAYGCGARLPEAPLRNRLAAALSAPMVADSAQQLVETRAAQTDALEALADHLRHAPPQARTLDTLAWSHFTLAYMGQDDTTLMHTLGAVMQRAATRTAPALAGAPDCRHPRRVLLAGSAFRDCTAGAYFGGWIGWLRNAGFEVVVYQLGPGRDAETERMAALASRFHFVEEATSLDSLAEQLRAEQAALILYPELGMDSRLYPLAALRLARRQAMAWGHPVTAGMPGIDAYLSCAAMEPPEAARHYLEPLHLLPGLGIDYRRPPLPPAATRAELGLPTQGPLLLAPQSLFKLHPDNDAVYAGLLQRLAQAQLLFFDDRPAWRDALSQRLQRAGVDARRTHWLPAGSRARYLQINAACDLMLDSQHFSGGNASLDALQSGLPVLTTPGRFMRGRQTAAMLGRIGLQDALCVDDPSQLAVRAVELIESGEAHALRDTIRQRLPDLFEAESARCAFIEHIRNLT